MGTIDAGHGGHGREEDEMEIRRVTEGFGMLERIEDGTIERMIRELQSDMADLVEAGEMTAEEANEWINYKADQWANGLS